VANPFSDLTDKELMLKYQAGDNMAFDVLYSRHKDKVYSYLSKRLRDQDQCEDLFQKVFTKFHRSKKLYNSNYQVLPWLYTITKSEFLDFIKKRHHIKTEFVEEQHTFHQNKTEPIFDLNSEDTLSLDEREAITLRYLNEFDFLEIAKILNKTETNTRKILSRGLQKLKQKYTGVKS
jgi:RNA polymerase sigma-70 factor, ECF subfamily